MKQIVKIALSATFLVFGFSHLAFATKINYTSDCPTIGQLKPITFNGSNGSYYFVGTNQNNINFKANTAHTHNIFRQDQAPKPQNIDTSLTSFSQKSNTLRCVYNMLNDMGYPVLYSVSNQGAYQECANDDLVLANSPCPKN